MAYTGDAEHTMLAALAPTHVGVYEAATAVTSWTGTATGQKLKSGAAHGYVDKDLVVLNSITGGTGLVAERIYWVKKVSTTEIELFPLYALTGTGETFTTNVTEASFSKLIEATGGSPEYKRKALTIEAAANRLRKSKAAEEPEVDVKAGQVVDFVGTFSASTEAKTVLAVAKVTKETFAGQGIYKIKESTLDLLAAP